MKTILLLIAIVSSMLTFSQTTSTNDSINGIVKSDVNKPVCTKNNKTIMITGVPIGVSVCVYSMNGMQIMKPYVSTGKAIKCRTGVAPSIVRIGKTYRIVH